MGFVPLEYFNIEEGLAVMWFSIGWRHKMKDTQTTAVAVGGFDESNPYMNFI
jgi:hypothetical protein